MNIARYGVRWDLRIGGLGRGPRESWVLDLPGGHFFEGSFVAFEDFLALGVRQPRPHVIIPHQQINEIFQADAGCWEVNFGALNYV